MERDFESIRRSTRGRSCCGSQTRGPGQRLRKVEGLGHFVRAGGSVLATLGARTAQLKAEPITQLALRKTTDTELRVATIDDSHPVLREASGWHAVRFMKHVDVQLGEQDRALITLGDQSPLLEGQVHLKASFAV